MSSYNDNIKDVNLEIDGEIYSVNKLLELDYNETIQYLHNSILTLANDTDENYQNIENIINFLEFLCSYETNCVHLDFILSKVKDVICVFNQKFDLRKGNDILQSLENLKKEIICQEKKVYQNFYIKLLEEIIYSEHSLAKLQSLITINPGILDNTNEEGKDILYLLIEKFTKLNKKEDILEIQYLYQVIVLIFNSYSFKKKNHDLSVYLELLNEDLTKNNKHIKDLRDRLEEKQIIPIEKIENKYAIHLVYPRKLENEVLSFSVDNKGRYDFTKQDTITIDGVEDKCLDDALYMKKNKDGTHTLFVHITDIPSFVPYHSLVQKEAIKREETLYLCDMVSSIYPENISNYTCSLLPNHNRNTITYIILLSPDFNIIDFKISKGKIRVKNRLSYEEVDKMLKNHDSSKLGFMLRDLTEFSLSQKSKNPIKNQYRQLENRINNNSYHQSTRTDWSMSANIVQESMVAVNHLIPKYFKKESLPYPNRVLHTKPNEFYQRKLEILLQKDHIVLGKKEKEKIVKQLKEISWRARYSITDHGHDGLGYGYYSHSTSPARRAMDSFGQYMIYEFIFQENLTTPNIQKWEEEASQVCKYLNERKIINDAFSNQYNYLTSKKLIKKKN